MWVKPNDTCLSTLTPVLCFLKPGVCLCTKPWCFGCFKDGVAQYLAVVVETYEYGKVTSESVRVS